LSFCYQKNLTWKCVRWPAWTWPAALGPWRWCCTLWGSAPWLSSATKCLESRRRSSSQPL